MSDRPCSVATDPAYASMRPDELDELFKTRLGELFREVYGATAKGKSAQASAWRTLAGFAYSEVFDYAIRSIVERSGFHFDMNALVAKVNAARHAGLDNTSIGEIFCREYDKLRTP